MTTSQNNFTINEILDFIKDKLFKDGGFEKVRILSKTIREKNSYDGFNKINKDDFLICLRDIGVLLSKTAAEKLVQHFDKDIDGYVNISEFLIGIRGLPSEARQQTIDEAFRKFDKDGTGFIDITDLKGVFNGGIHPKVISGEITQEQAFDNFIKNFNDRTGRGKVEILEWNDYYAAVSASVPNDEHFIYLVKSVWNF